MAKRNTDPAVARAVLDRLTDVGLVDDRGFAEAWVASRQDHKHLSRLALREELVKKRVDRWIIDEVLSAVDTEQEYAAASALATRKARSMTGLAPEVRRRRLAGALARRGFSGSVTSRVLSDLDLEGRTLTSMPGLRARAMTSRMPEAQCDHAPTRPGMRSGSSGVCGVSVRCPVRVVQ
nr:regulatory protein RecX [Raineyella fluvialis]